MENALTIFKAPVSGAPIRVVDRGGNPWFVAADVCKALGIGETDVALRRLSTDEKGPCEIRTSSRGSIEQKRSMSVVTESGLYKLVMRSNKPEAAAFQNWVAKDVLPTIRKTGSYVMGEEKLNDPATPLSDIEQLSDQIIALLQRKAAILEANVTRLQDVNAVMAPKAAIVDAHVAPREWDSIARFARTLDGVNTNAVKRSLAAEGYLWRCKQGAYRVYAEFRDRLFVEKLNRISGEMDIFVTEAGRAKLVELYEGGKLRMKLAA